MCIAPTARTIQKTPSSHSTHLSRRNCTAKNDEIIYARLKPDESENAIVFCLNKCYDNFTLNFTF